MANTKEEVFSHGKYSVRHWRESDRDAVAALIRECLESYGLEFEAKGADLDAIAVEEHYLKGERGEFWVVVDRESDKIVGSGGYYRLLDQPENTESGGGEADGEVEIRKMYLLPEARGKKLGRALLEQLERRIIDKGYRCVCVETASVLKEACSLYTSAGYTPTKGVETQRCDKRLFKTLTA